MDGRTNLSTALQTLVIMSWIFWTKTRFIGDQWVRKTVIIKYYSKINDLFFLCSVFNTRIISFSILVLFGSTLLTERLTTRLWCHIFKSCVVQSIDGPFVYFPYNRTNYYSGYCKLWYNFFLEIQLHFSFTFILNNV